MFEQSLPPVVHVALQLETSDVPAGRKITGRSGHAHNTHPCDSCFVTLAEINTLDAYNVLSKSNSLSSFISIDRVQSSSYEMTGSL